MDRRRTLVLIILAAGLAAGARGLGASIAAAASQPGSEKPVIYNHILQPGAALDRLVHQTYDAAFKVEDFTDADHVYIPPRQTAGPSPTAPVDSSGKAVGGKVVAFYIVTALGRVEHPVIISSSDPQLSAAVLGALAQRVYEPARIDGWNAATTAGEEFPFPPPAP